MAKQTFTAGQVLTAAQVNNLQTDIFNQTTSTKTANYTLLVGDRGTRLIGNGTSITFTVDNSIFTAGDTIKLHNINSTVLTIAAGAGVTINAAAGLTIAQYQEATLFATSASSFILFESTASSANGLTLLNTTSFSAVNSVSLPTGTFSSTYQNYKIILNITTASTNDYFGARYRASGSDISTGAYQSSYLNVNIAAATSGLGSSGSNQTTFTRMGYHLAFQPFYFEATWWSPNLAVSKGYTGTALQIGTDGGEHFYTGGSFDDNTIADSVSFFPISGTFTGTLYCYGINK